ncbi:lipoprotein N-acyltransferase Lnb domain-containing protein [Pseudomonas sp. CGJS7]|uniref:lipoprotein N-acyltransferase Lnb domain-containing protein n=1 Tax=Pseudomonas sp. CGJS7 TaxID=3109348 RepID=UPI00300B0E18
MTSSFRFVRLYALAVLLLIQSLAHASTEPTADKTSTAAPTEAAAAMQTPSPAAATTPKNPRIGMVTMQPGQEFWSRFGHDALVVLDQDTGQATSYNFGYFDPSEPDFIQRFIRNDMRYRLLAVPFDQDMAQYGYEGRGVSVQWLDLTQAQAAQLAEALRVNALPENAYYRYQYFDDNCATRVRDAIDRTLGGALRRQSEGRSHGNTLRSEALRLSKPDLWMWASLDILLGPESDKPVPVWAESYVPNRLAAALREVKTDQGRPLVQAERELLPHRISPDPEATPLPWWPWALAGLALAAALAWIGDRSPRVLAIAALPLWGLLGVIGVLLAYVWFGTGHSYGWANRNLLLFNPLCLLLWFGGWRALRGRETGPVFVWLTGLVALGALAALFLYWLPVYPQRNAHWIALWLPVHVGLWFGFRKAARLRLA